MKIALISKNKYLWQKLRLIFPSDEIALCDFKITDSDRLLWDCDTADGTPPEDAILISRSGNGLSPHFTREELLPTLGGRARLYLNESGRTVTLDGKRVKLTELEFSLLSLLYASRGKFVSRSTIIEKVWGEVGNDGLTNVYIHYLREKLETGNERLIFSSRKEGYMLKIDEEGER